MKNKKIWTIIIVIVILAILIYVFNNTSKFAKGGPIKVNQNRTCDCTPYGGQGGFIQGNIPCWRSCKWACMNS